MKKKPAPKTSKKASSKRQQIIVLEDGANNYYELSRATFERCRVDKRHRLGIEKKLKERPGEFWYIDAPCIPGSIVAPPFEGGCQLHYAGFYLTSAKAKR
jgi:hypothetical protein